MPEKKNIKIATFNVNSVRARLPIILNWIEMNSPDILCLQETKVMDELFPVDEFDQQGYNCLFHGQKSYNGVAILSREKSKKSGFGLGDKDEPNQARLIWANISGINVVNTYVPQGRDVDTEYFQYKLEWLKRLKIFFDKNFTSRQKVLWCGDINTAPTDLDVHDPKRIKGHVCFNDELTAALKDVTDWGFHDVFRKHHPDEEGQFSWFDYRVRGSVERNLGWRVDHVFVTNSLLNKSVNSYIDLEPRKMEKPSDHTPVVAEFEI